MAKQLSIEMHEAKVKMFYHLHEKVPGSNDLGEATLAMMLKKYGSWNDAMLSLLGQPAQRHMWDDDEIILLIRSLYQKNKRFPTWQEIREIKPSLSETIRTRFGGLDEAMEKAIGASPRVATLFALRDLTIGDVPEASVHEIIDVLSKSGIDLSTVALGIALGRAKQKGYVKGRILGQIMLWQLTDAGKIFLKTFDAK
jgi:hypothetical protein